MFHRLSLGFGFSHDVAKGIGIQVGNDSKWSIAHYIRAEAKGKGAAFSGIMVENSQEGMGGAHPLWRRRGHGVTTEGTKGFMLPKLPGEEGITFTEGMAGVGVEQTGQHGGGIEGDVVLLQPGRYFLLEVLIDLPAIVG